MDKRILGIILGIFIFISGFFIGEIPGLTGEGKDVLILLAIALVLWLTEAIPLGITSMLLLVLQPILGITNLKNSVAAFSNPVIFFVIANFGVSYAITKSSIAKRMLFFLLKRFGTNTNTILFAFMSATCLISSIMSNVPATALFMGLALGLVDLADQENIRKSIGRTFMIAIPFAGMIGGIMTPAGSSINILTLNLMKEYSNAHISFVEWMLIGIPIAIVLLPMTWFILVKIYKPMNMNPDKINEFIQGYSVENKMEPLDKKVAAIILGMLAFWVLSSWIPALDVTIVAIIGLAIMFLPGIDILNWPEFSKSVSLNTILMIGSVISVSSAVVSTGVGEWLLKNFFDVPQDISIVLLLGILGIFIALLHLPIPIAPAIVMIMLYPLVSVAANMDISIIAFGVPMAFYAGCCMMLPLDPVPLLTYSTGYYTMLDMFKGGSLATLSWIAFTSIWTPVALTMLGIL
ncbi:sodium-dependent dicarboxylate transporter 2/3/5 [Anaerosolibacter carboniphilus]|uniref:Sodium-dependent dicarboxylate transporter 2/3/5 n=1 Tax=Anaerosolibacter carboniphilus TaxID=1417629 RepID=A0A841KUG0_9FIRM|nr:SLC13 family permease [Anaerosolibacter carboniphilus]MBB6217344.1 sodium-dependent dicarboxylate transporter 2/3/5 [Anaerosolibacter carboniphilus]